MEEGDENYNRAEVQKGIEFYRKFSLDSKSEFCEDPKKALTVGGRAGRLNGKKYRPNELKMDPDFFTKAFQRWSTRIKGSGSLANNSTSADLREICSRAPGADPC